MDKISPILQSISQEQPSSTIPSTIPPVDRDWPEFSWIFNNVDFQHWETVPGSQILLIYGPPGRNLHRVSSYIANESSLKKQRDVLFHSCLSESSGKRAVSRLTCALFYQLICQSSKDRQKTIIEKFINILVKRIYQVEENYYTELEIFKKSSEIWLRKILDTSTQALWTALMAVLIKEPRREILVVIDGLEKVQDETREFINNLQVFVDHVRQRQLNIKVLLTSRPQADIQEAFDDLPSIEHDKERRGNSCALSYTVNQANISKFRVSDQSSLQKLTLQSDRKRTRRLFGVDLDTRPIQRVVKAKCLSIPISPRKTWQRKKHFYQIFQRESLETGSSCKGCDCGQVLLQ